MTFVDELILLFAGGFVVITMTTSLAEGMQVNGKVSLMTWKARSSWCIDTSSRMETSQRRFPWGTRVKKVRSSSAFAILYFEWMPLDLCWSHSSSTLCLWHRALDYFWTLPTWLWMNCRAKRSSSIHLLVLVWVHDTTFHLVVVWYP